MVLTLMTEDAGYGAAPGPTDRSSILPRKTTTAAEAELIEKRAYDVFLARGAAHGADLDDWLEAERQLRDAGLIGARKAAPKATKAAPKATRAAPKTTKKRESVEKHS